MYSKKNITLFVILCFVVFGTLVCEAQVTIGSGLPPKSGALLDLKEYDTRADNSNSTKGLGLPRVKLVERSSLLPTVSAQEASDFAVKQLHIGMILYNSGVENTESVENQLCKGVHVWMGNKWMPLKSYPRAILGESVVRCKEGPAYTIVPNSIKVYGTYTKNTVLDNTHYIEVTINASTSIIGGEYVIQTYSSTTNEL